MFKIFQSFSTELKFYLLMSTFFSFGCSLSGVFQSVFLWKLDKTYSLLAYYSLYWSLAIIVFFGVCAWIARKTSPMITMRLGFVFYLITYLIMLGFHNTLQDHIFLLGMSNGLAMSLYYVGVHMAVLDLTTNDKRDQFLYVQGILLTIGGVIAPLIAGVLISQYNGMFGYYVVFIATCVFFFISFLISLKVKGSPVTTKSYFWDVIKRPSPEWQKMYKVMFADGIVSGVYTTFLITMITFKVAGGELSLGVYNTAAEIVAIVAFYVLAKFSNPKFRLAIFAIGSLSVFLSSTLLSAMPVLASLVVFGIVSPVAMNMINTSMNAMIYESIEKDPHYKERRLDYIIIREIPLGVGRIIGVFLFLAMRKFFDFEQLLPVSFSLFPIVYVIMIPALYIIWKKPKKEAVLGSNKC
ncbi:YQGE family putative transporter [Bacillus sp. SORGH_AS 510]|uniref:MFS transporter n=1 Tax=Bacillus sp. SORGH_AS_0510 TaxID=3041771 RepID=UPI00278B2447|nr:MFS transporter [Bacillus sp. SORGH_AS_0510]MDQ1144155.1 YQGE family putative transporter [Bacillus sp. SORGH_AS_0510]